MKRRPIGVISATHWPLVLVLVSERVTDHWALAKVEKTSGEFVGNGCAYGDFYCRFQTKNALWSLSTTPIGIASTQKWQMRERTYLGV